MGERLNASGACTMRTYVQQALHSPLRNGGELPKDTPEWKKALLDLGERVMGTRPQNISLFNSSHLNLVEPSDHVDAVKKGSTANTVDFQWSKSTCPTDRDTYHTLVVGNHNEIPSHPELRLSNKYFNR